LADRGEWAQDWTLLLWERRGFKEVVSVGSETLAGAPKKAQGQVVKTQIVHFGIGPIES